MLKSSKFIIALFILAIFLLSVYLIFNSRKPGYQLTVQTISHIGGKPQENVLVYIKKSKPLGLNGLQTIKSERTNNTGTAKFILKENVYVVEDEYERWKVVELNNPQIVVLEGFGPIR
ncbi:hypothetical protein A2863_00570 [Candidatus Woesebacteria bacterium RIFCSPHIGHO2_01_FULL_38_9b]|uniref:Uncharacterized protein n=1 Tax=Candidatus Woesebacteria bacterium RIFCSPHIGHO2_01_FULL_38_9b TaxID=1802493 RepID=A0A1F7Y0G1_9BACT|nr:MAG: hypothetical protein A2863_00570 [Candidatus Woesebacteria bacterium RIFCSPHIGHO2_01_FULL_38_9b]